MEKNTKHPTLQGADPAYYVELKKRAQQNRGNLTEAEKQLWYFLSGRKGLLGYRFRRQHVIGQYIVDFVCLRKKLIIEVDGGYHFTPDQIYEDEIRTDYLTKAGYKVIRFTNNQIFYKLDFVINSIQTHLTNEIAH